MKQVLPPNDNYTYIIESYQESNKHTQNAPNFSVTACINVQNRGSKTVGSSNVRAQQMYLSCDKNIEAGYEIKTHHALPTLCKKANSEAEGKVSTIKSKKGQTTTAFSDLKQENQLPI